MALAVTISCGAPPTAPQNPAPVGVPGTLTWSGQVLAQHDQLPVAGAVIEASQAEPQFVVSGLDGRFTIGNLSKGVVLFSVTAPGYLNYRSRIDLTGKPAELPIQLIPASAPFDLKFYRDFARAAQDGVVIETRRWTVNPSFYFQTVTVDTGQPVATGTLDAIESLFRAAVPELSAGQLKVAGVQRGLENPIPQSGRVSVRFYSGLIEGIPGRGGDATVGGNSGTMRIRYGADLDVGALNQSRKCESYATAVADHEIMHIMGYYHTDASHLDFASGPGCPGAGHPDRVKYHASVMYARPPGNRDLDNDAPNFAHLLFTPDAIQKRVSCDLESFFGGRK